jgi:glucosamine-6-phosphate deaminase
VLRQLKALILRGELRDALVALNLNADKGVFLDLPFYEQGRYRRFVSTAEDVKLVAAHIRDFKPHQIYLTGDAADPSSVPSICFKIIEAALKQCEPEEWFGSCTFWLYRGKEKALEPHEIDMAVPLSPVQVARKSRALAKYQALTSMERDIAEINREAARRYDALGMAEYEAMECFQRWKRA